MKAFLFNDFTMKLEEIEYQHLPKIISDLFTGPAFPVFNPQKGIFTIRYEREIDGMLVCGNVNPETVMMLAAKESAAIYQDAIRTAEDAAVKQLTEVYKALKALDPPWFK